MYEYIYVLNDSSQIKEHVINKYVNNAANNITACKRINKRLKVNMLKLYFNIYHIP